MCFKAPELCPHSSHASTTSSKFLYAYIQSYREQLIHLGQRPGSRCRTLRTRRMLSPGGWVDNKSHQATLSSNRSWAQNQTRNPSNLNSSSSIIRYNNHLCPDVNTLTILDSCHQMTWISNRYRFECDGKMRRERHVLFFRNSFAPE